MRRSLSAILFLAASCAALPLRGADDAGMQFFENRIRPVLSSACYQCHSATARKLKGNLFVDSREGLIKGGDSGAAIVPGDLDHSKLMEALSWSNVDLQMPPRQKLSDAQIADFKSWIAMGAPWPAGAVAAGPKTPVFDLQKRRASHWCWEPIRRPAIPAVKHGDWVQNPIDAFILAKLQEKGLEPAPRADRATLIRRAYFDVIGLPPTPAQVAAFVNDPDPSAFARVVDDLLASPHFGERWARHWMDLVRYAETRGHEFDPLIPNAWEYRDYLVRAINSDVPYDQFVREHLAGDLLPHPRLNPQEHFNESILGTGFWFLGEEVHSPVDMHQDEADRLNNRIDTMTKALMGLTVGCARCHDHKFDAISQKDFYALQGFLLSAGYRQAPFKSMEQNRTVAQQLDALRGEARTRLTARLVEALEPGLGRTADYLLASRQVSLSGEASGAALTDVANRQSLDPALLGRWVTELAAAKKSPDHPLHAYATLSDRADVDSPVKFVAEIRPMFERWDRSLRAAREQLAPIQTLADFGDPATPFYRDGEAFGLRPTPAGQLLLGDDAENLLEGVSRFGAVRRDWAFANIRPAPGNEPDAGRLGPWYRSGQMVRTAKVTLKSGHLWYLVRGAGRAFAVVDSYLVDDGPLYENLTHAWPRVKGDAWHWVEHNLSDYAGQRCHIEFSPADRGNLEIAKVIEIDAKGPPPTLDADNGVMLSALRDPTVDSLDAMAHACQKVLQSAAEQMAAGSISASSDVPDVARLADFLVRRHTLFTTAFRPELLEESRRFASAQVELARQVINQSPTAPAMWDGNGIDEHVLVRGQAKNPGDLSPRRFIEAIAGSSQPACPSESSGRLQLADAMLADSDPFPARVMVNRVWYHLFGRGIVPTVDNFGVLGQSPTHRELLDYLADAFRMEQGWSTKQLIRSIMLSSAYQMSSRANPAADALDPQNLTLHHMPIRRLEAEAIRDAMLAVSGRLDPKLGGPSVEVYLTPFMQGRGRPRGGPLDGDGRRSLYIRVRRNFLSPMLLAFDAPSPFACVGHRNVSNVPAQALTLMNDPLVHQLAESWAKRALADADQSAGQRVGQMYLAAFSRQPSAGELADALAFLDQQGEAYGLKASDRRRDPRCWTDLCHVMFNLKEFIFIE